MKKNLFILSVLLILNNCGGFEFVYKTQNNDFLAKNTTITHVDGDDANKIRVALIDMFGNHDEFPKYKLTVNSLKTESAEVIKKDATASKFKIQYLISYNFYNMNKNCKVFNKEITTLGTYSVKSSSYSFGTDFSKDDSAANSIDKNINEFIISLNAFASLNKCIAND